MSLSNKDSIKVNYTIDSDSIQIKKAKNFIMCVKCNCNLGIINEGSLLLKSIVSILDFDDNSITVKCMKCKNYNTFNIDKAKQKNNKCLLTI